MRKQKHYVRKAVIGHVIRIVSKIHSILWKGDIIFITFETFRSFVNGFVMYISRSLKGHVSVHPRNKQKNIFRWHLKGHWRKKQDPERDPDPLSQLYGSADPDPFQDFVNPQHWPKKYRNLVKIHSKTLPLAANVFAWRKIIAVWSYSPSIFYIHESQMLNNR